MFCIECGVPNPDNAKFCNACGKSMVVQAAAPEPHEAVLVCGSCNQENPADYRFCQRCGKALSDVQVNAKPTFESKGPTPIDVAPLPEEPKPKQQHMSRQEQHGNKSTTQQKLYFQQEYDKAE